MASFIFKIVFGAFLIAYLLIVSCIYFFIYLFLILAVLVLQRNLLSIVDRLTGGGDVAAIFIAACQSKHDSNIRLQITEILVSLVHISCPLVVKTLPAAVTLLSPPLGPCLRPVLPSAASRPGG